MYGQFTTENDIPHVGNGAGIFMEELITLARIRRALFPNDHKPVGVASLKDGFFAYFPWHKGLHITALADHREISAHLTRESSLPTGERRKRVFALPIDVPTLDTALSQAFRRLGIDDEHFRVHMLNPYLENAIMLPFPIVPRDMLTLFPIGRKILFREANLAILKGVRAGELASAPWHVFLIFQSLGKI